MQRREHVRRSIRLRTFDYSSTAVYFVTLCVRGREKALGEVADGRVVLNAEGRVVDACWRALAEHFDNVTLDAYVVMPDHFHGLIAIASGRMCEDIERRLLRPGPPPRSLGAVIGAFKAASSRDINRLRGTVGDRIWQRNYYEHIVRSDHDLQRIREYIHNNPHRWQMTERQT